jgi:RNA polymerase sigma factor (sigma-70 family)
MSIANRYLRGQRYRDVDVAKDVGLSKTEFLRVITTTFGSYAELVRTVIPGNTKTLRCRWCFSLIQANKKDSKATYCVDCRRRNATNLLKARLRRGEPIHYAAISADRRLRWIVQQAPVLWGKPYSEAVYEELGVKGLRSPPKDSPTEPKKRGRKPASSTKFRSLAERNVMVEENLNLVFKFVDAFILRKPLRSGMTRDDLVQEARLGLIRASELFDPSKGFKFSTYATWWIRQRLDRAWMQSNFSVKIPARYRFGTAREDALQEAEDRKEKGKPWQPAPVDPLLVGSLDGVSEVIQGYMGIGYEEPGYDEVETRLDLEELEDYLHRLAAQNGIPYDHIGIFCMRVLGGSSLGAVGEKYNLSRERVRQLVSQVKDKLKSAYVRRRDLPKP